MMNIKMVLTFIGNLFSFSKTTKTSVTLETEVALQLRSARSSLKQPELQVAMSQAAGAALRCSTAHYNHWQRRRSRCGDCMYRAA